MLNFLGVSVLPSDNPLRLVFWLGGCRSTESILETDVRCVSVLRERSGSANDGRVIAPAFHFGEGGNER